MTLQPFREEQLNYFKFAYVVINEFPKALRETFTSMWNKRYGYLWDDSIATRNLFFGKEVSKTTKVLKHLSYDEWDCTALFQATIYARSFALPDGKGLHKTLSELYVNKLPHGKFHVSVVSPSRNNAETFALAIDQLRLLRNALCHSTSSETDKATFDHRVQHAKDAFKALGVKTDPIDAVGGLTESDFPTKRVRALEEDIRKELQKDKQFLEEEVKDGLLKVKSYITSNTAVLVVCYFCVTVLLLLFYCSAESNQDLHIKRTEEERKKELQILKNQLQFDKEELKEELRNTVEKYKETTEVSQEVTERTRLGNFLMFMIAHRE